MKIYNIKSIIFLLMVIFAGVTFFACSDDEKEERKTIVMDEVSDYLSCDITNCPPDTVIIINNDEELKNICPDISIFPIDFYRYSLLIVHSVTPQGISHIFADLTKEKSLKYNLSIYIELNDTAVAQRWYKCFVTPKKIDSNASVELKVNYK